MANLKEDLFYSETHEWLKVENDYGLIGITDYAQKELGNVVFIELPEKGKVFKKGESFGSIESVKSVSDLYAPVDFEVIEVNSDLAKNPELVNDDPYGKGWMIKVKILDKNQINSLLKSKDYEKIIS